jgi:hypothetical protein
MELVSFGNLFYMFASSRHAAYSVVPIGIYAEYVLSTMDKVVNWARQGSMWPMTCELPPFLIYIDSPWLIQDLPRCQSCSQSVSHVAPSR